MACIGFFSSKSAEGSGARWRALVETAAYVHDRYTEAALRRMTEDVATHPWQYVLELTARQVKTLVVINVVDASEMTASLREMARSLLDAGAVRHLRGLGKPFVVRVGERRDLVWPLDDPTCIDPAALLAWRFEHRRELYVESGVDYVVGSASAFGATVHMPGWGATGCPVTIHLAVENTDAPRAPKRADA